jgi:protocatechuate 3,4-dioxygenase beta subunit
MPAPLQLDTATTDPGRIELRLTSKPANTLRGRVVDAGGAPVAGAEVNLLSRLDTGNFDGAGSPDPATKAKTTVDGRFEFHGLWPKTEYSVSAVRLVESGSALRIDVASAEGVTITENESRELPELTLHPQKSND